MLRGMLPFRTAAVSPSRSDIYSPASARGGPIKGTLIRGDLMDRTETVRVLITPACNPLVFNCQSDVRELMTDRRASAVKTLWWGN
jgi:hypothetical protein